MAVMKKGTFAIDIGFVKIGADFEEADRQCAWELYTKLATRVAVTGKPKDPDCTDFSGEVYAESFASLLTFFGESRKIMRAFPVGSIWQAKIENHLGALIHRAMRDVLRPFLEQWQAGYRFWWESKADKAQSPFDRQGAYPRVKEMLSQWGATSDQSCARYRTSLSIQTSW